MEKEHLDMISNAFEHLQKASLKIKTEQVLIFQRPNSLSRPSSKWKFDHSTNGQNRSINETKAPH